ncbi:MAG: uridylate kinase [Methyloprofundus sp.]|nr:uridylate kinase [Methyloprofundus sp.]
MMVLKLGGSLLSSPAALMQCLQLACQQEQGQLVIVPGGGVFADQVRLTQKQWQYDDKVAHYMAILAMQQMALLLQGLCADLVLVDKVAAIAPALQRHKLVVWSPLASELDAAGIPASWDVTSDTLAAWLAIQLSAARLILVKSAELPENATLEQLSISGVIDKALTRLVHNSPLMIECISIHQLPFLATCLKNNA